MRSLVGYVNVISETGYRWQGKEVVECEIPEYNKPNLQICRDTLMEAVAETSEEFMERYFSGESFSEAEIRAALRTNIDDGTIVPCPWAPIFWDRVFIPCLTISLNISPARRDGNMPVQYENKGNFSGEFRFCKGEERFYLQDYSGCLLSASIL